MIEGRAEMSDYFVPASVRRVWRENAKLRYRHQSQMLALATVADAAICHLRDDLEFVAMRDTALALQAWVKIREQIR